MKSQVFTAHTVAHSGECTSVQVVLAKDAADEIAALETDVRQAWAHSDDYKAKWIAAERERDAARAAIAKLEMYASVRRWFDHARAPEREGDDK
jgi:hypothetical protein